MQSHLIAAEVDAIVERAVVEHRLVGVSVVVGVGGRVVYRRSAGSADRNTGRPLRDDAIFLLASVTKPFVSVLAMQLAEAGHLDLAAPVSRYLPDFRPALPDGSRPDISVLQLLTHTAGLPYGMSPGDYTAFHAAGASNGMDVPGLSSAEAAHRLAGVPLLFAPGTDWEYSTGMDVVGWVIEAVTGRRLGESVAERITGPLGIADTGFTVSDAARLVSCYSDAAPVPRAVGEQSVIVTGPNRTTVTPGRVLDPASYHSGGAGMVGTASGVWTFLEAVRTGRLLTAESRTRMLTGQAGMDKIPTGPGVGFGIGWAVLDDPARNGSPQSKGTLNWAGTYGHNWFIDPVREITVVSLSNTTPAGMFSDYTLQLRDAVYRRL
ncbi:serine hydrolase domain-containing protein [Catenulispora pinisilvae]|uniref:serine hydrolase domain-containing protein n=1 Tax=Catenulispora pinisilvae TaxID=2705253 RepID=UPI001891A436|nr:serine hydrolase domain-containing protein [Catenulispora pinisilvae]